MKTLYKISASVTDNLITHFTIFAFIGCLVVVLAILALLVPMIVASAVLLAYAMLAGVFCPWFAERSASSQEIH